MIIKFNCNKIQVNDLILKPSETYGADIEGVFDFSKENFYANTVSDGQVLGYNKNTSKNIILNVFVKKHNDIISHLKLNALLSQPTVTLYLNYDEIGDVEMKVNLSSKSTSGNYAGAISVDLIAPDPYVYTRESVLLLGVVYANGLKLPMKMPFKFDSNIAGGIGVLKNIGFVDAFPVIEVTGPSTWFELENTTTGQKNRIELELTENDVLKIDNRPLMLGVYKNGIRQNDINLDTWYSCSPGDNVWSFKRDTPLESTRNCKVTLQSRFI